MLPPPMCSILHRRRRAAMVGLGLALARPDRRVAVVTGDGDMLMGIASLGLVCTENSDSHVVVMQSAEEHMRRDATDALNRARERRVFVQRSVRSQIVVIAGIGLQNPA
jgi:thiamine pyrophosphate-dependent acetolactate synthase large subunit-like protein